MRRFLTVLFLPLLFTACKPSYSFNGASIDYNVTKTIYLKDFQNQAQLVYAPLTQVFNEKMKDVFIRNTKLIFTDRNPDMEIEGEIVRYDLTPQAVKQEGNQSLASATRLTMAVKIRFRNNKNPREDKEETISAYRDFSSNRMLTDVQDELITELTQEIVDQIFNTTMSNW